MDVVMNRSCAPIGDHVLHCVAAQRGAVPMALLTEQLENRFVKLGVRDRCELCANQGPVAGGASE